jgi:hypothetical protein
MIRICFTLIAYIVSFLSHSNELPEMAEEPIFHEGKSQTGYVIRMDSINQEGDLYLNDLN